MKRIMLAALLLSLQVHAADAPKQQKAAELVNIMNVDATLNRTYSRMEAMMKQMGAKMGVKPSEQPIFDKYYKKMTEVMKQNMNWAKMKPSVVKLYEDNFTDQQLDDMLNFYKSDTGKAIINKMPVVMGQVMQQTQQMTQQMLPQLRQLTRQLQTELAAERKKEKDAAATGK
ncbi:DUF2059 domain-containing protein [Gallaecimonas sp. GXIMD1310]|uniref:DUF2059 domain-containing protein n=1 Tax=Gallaecimonas sp. GXIMD1310 TaxID=3131926 RepID=UPI0032526B53